MDFDHFYYKNIAWQVKSRETFFESLALSLELVWTLVFGFQSNKASEIQKRDQISDNVWNLNCLETKKFWNPYFVCRYVVLISDTFCTNMCLVYYLKVPEKKYSFICGWAMYSEYLISKLRILDFRHSNYVLVSKQIEFQTLVKL